MQIGWGLYVFRSKSLPSHAADNHMITVAKRRCQRVDLYARRGNNSWKPQGGTCLNPMITLLHLCSPDSKANILVNRNGRACLAGFGLLTMAEEQPAYTPSSMQGGTVRWMSPELIAPEMFGLKVGRPTKESDYYGLGMVVYEVLSGETPFGPDRNFTIIWKILWGKRPERPQGEGGKPFTNDMWSMLEDCWKHQPQDRMSASAVLLRLERHPPLSRPSFTLDVDGGAETGSDDESGSGVDDEWVSDIDDQSEPGSDDEWYPTASDCTFPPFHPRLTFDSPRVV